MLLVNVLWAERKTTSFNSGAFHRSQTQHIPLSFFFKRRNFTQDTRTNAHADQHVHTHSAPRTGRSDQGLGHNALTPPAAGLAVVT